ncbi:hypothetical protein NF552_23240 (plasmid) [Roseomonas mucosa]|nr:hypothetical protein NF552_23240 [Roseomonas mucosa]
MTPAQRAVSGMVGCDAACFVARTLVLSSTLELEEPWNAEMVRPLTERSANIARVDVSMPPRFREAIRRIMDARNRIPGQRRICARDLHEEAINALVERAEAGEPILFMASPIGTGRATLWMDEGLKARVDGLALAHGVHRSAVVLTAFHHFLRHADVADKADAA